MTNPFPHLQLHLLATPQRLSSLGATEYQSELLKLTPQEVGQQLMQVTFESVAARLQLLDRMFVEMDGSFVWTGEEQLHRSAPAIRWQLDGMLYDVNHHVQRMELKGCCPHSRWRQLLNTLDWPTQSLVAYQHALGSFVDIETFEHCLWPN